MAKSAVIIIRVTPEMKRDVEDLAKASRRTVSNYLRLILEDLIAARQKK